MKSSISGNSGKGQRNAVQYAGSNLDEQDNAFPRDKKFEGMSNLKGDHDRNQGRERKKAESAKGHQLQLDYINNLQKQVATMETEIKLLKDREVDQKNKASGYETLLRDGIPLNEHFLALKNKFNNEKDTLEKQFRATEDEMKRAQEENDAKKDRIEILRSEHDAITKKLNVYRETTTKNIKDLETKLYSETHTKNLLTEEKKKITAELTVKKNQNAQNDRVIKQAKHFTGKRDKIHKEMQKEHDQNAELIESLSKEIADMSWLKDKEERRLSDKQILAKQKAITTALTTESEQVNNDLLIAESRIKDLERQQKNSNEQILDILTEKRKVDKENLEMEHRLQGRGVTEADQKRLQFEAEREQITRLKTGLEYKNEMAQMMLEQLKQEEDLARNMLDAKINAEQEMELLSEEAAIVENKRAHNREELLRLQIKYSQLQSQKEKQKTELNKLTSSNESLGVQNTDLAKKNQKLDSDIQSLIQRIDLNTLLKEVDVEELKLLAVNNEHMNMAFMNMINRWDVIKRLDAKE